MISRLTAWIFCLATAVCAAPPNVLVIMTDQQMAEAMSHRLGHEFLNTPAMDSLAARGVRFDRAYAANPLCMPSRNAMFTGRFPHETGVTDNAPMHSGFLLDPARFPALGTRLQAAGYRTAYFGKWHLCYDRERPETHGFETFDRQQKDAVTAGHAVDYLTNVAADQPFLLVVSFLNPHNVAEFSRGQPLSNGAVGEPPPWPDLPPPPANLAPPAFEPDTMTLARRGYHANLRLFPVGDFQPSQWQVLRWGYYRMIEKVDAEIGRVLAALREAGHADNTLIVFLSDHGECAGAHGFVQKTVFYEESARVPLIVVPPGGVEARASDALVNTGVDLVPTLLDYAGAPPAPELPGASLRPWVEGGAAPGWRTEVVIGNRMSQVGVVGDIGFAPVTEGRMVRGERFKYCVYLHGERRESLVDLANDPGEMVDLAADPTYRDVLLDYRERLRRFGDRHGDTLVTALLADDVAPRPFAPEGEEGK